MRRVWAAVKLAVLGAVLGGLMGLGTGLGATALYRWGESQSAAPTGEQRPGPVSVPADSDAEGSQELAASLSRSGQARTH